MIREKRSFSAADAEILAIRAAGYLSADPDLLARFLALSGLSVADLRERLGELDLLAGVLDFILADEPVLIQFTEASEIDPTLVATARRLLPA